jgi:DNA-binding CsgD family transcriptional regulator
MKRRSAGTSENGARISGAESEASLSVGQFRSLDSLSVAALIAIGLGCYFGWQIIDISPTLFPAPLEGARDAILMARYAATVGLIALLMAFSHMARRRAPLFRSKGLIAFAGAVPAIGTAILYLSGWTGESASIVGVVVGRILFCASAAMVVLWGELLCYVQKSRLLACVSASYAVAFGICLLEAYLSEPCVYVFRVILPLVSCAVLFVIRADASDDVVFPADSLGRETKQRQSSPSDQHVPIRIFLGIGILGAVFTITNHLSESKTDVSTEMYTLYAGIFVSLLICLVACTAHRSRANFMMQYRLLTPLAIGCLALILVLQPGFQRYEALAIGASWVFFRIFTWTLWANIGSRNAMRGARIFAWGQITLTSFDVAAELVCSYFDLAQMPLVAVASCIILVTVLTSAFIMDEGAVVRWLAPKSQGDAAGGDLRESSEERRAYSAGSLERPGARLEPEDFRSGQYLGRRDANGISEDELRSAISQTGYSLSERELNIAALVLNGRADDEICKSACITKSTLRTHLRNIYGKLDVHSRSELIDRLSRLVRAGRS